MSALSALRKGRCPGALVPMRAGDGLLVRIRLAGGRLSLDRAAAIAECAARFGNGIIEISSRANLQLRGVSEFGLPDLQHRLDELGLLDASAAIEGVRNIVASPLSDIDPSAIVDVTRTVSALEARLSVETSLHRLPAKFGFLIDGGGALPLGDVEADLRFEGLRSEGAPRFAVSLAGADDIATICAPEGVPDAAAALALAFLRNTGENGPRRMRELVALRGAKSIFTAAGFTASAAPSPLRRRAGYMAFLGVHSVGATTCVGAAPSLGRMTADDLRVLAQEARRHSTTDIRLTPWRAFVVVGADSRAEDFAGALARQGFILDASDPRLAIVACSGAPACAHAAHAVQSDALAVAASVPAGRGIMLHVSGCEKGCAYNGAAPFTLVSRAAGYDLIAGGKASDAPMQRGLSMGEVAPLLAQFAGAGR